MSAPQTPPWTEGPDAPVLGEAAVHVWRADLDGAGDGVLELLSDEESERAAAGLRGLQSDRLARARGILRELLGRYLGRDPRSLSLLTGEEGKPRLEGEELSFNLSHSGGVAVYAFAETGEVGVDIQLAGVETEGDMAIARRFLAPEDALAIEKLEKRARGEALLREWVRHEAQGKCRGTGIGVASLRGGGESEGGLWVDDLEVGEGAAAALACEVEPEELSCWVWRARSP